MTGYEKGDYVVVTEDGAGAYVAAGGRAIYHAGDELVVTSVYADHLNVRMSSGSLVFRIPPGRVRKPTRKIGEVPPGALPPEHPGIAWVFDDAARMADRLGLCGDFDRLCDALGVPGRVRTFTVDVFSTEGMKVTAKVQARSQRLAEQRVREQMSPPSPRELTQMREGTPQ